MTDALRELGWLTSYDCGSKGEKFVTILPFATYALPRNTKPCNGLKCPNCEGRGWTNYMNPNTYQFSPGIHSQCMWCWGEGTLTAERLAECRAQ